MTARSFVLNTTKILCGGILIRDYFIEAAFVSSIYEIKNLFFSALEIQCNLL